MATNRAEKWLTQQGLEQLEEWARQGITNDQIAYNMGISQSTLYRWMKDYPNMTDAIDRGKRPVDFEVENALLKIALGYNYDEEQVTNQGKVVKVKKHHSPSPTAIKFWLSNRKPEWNEKRQMDFTGDLPVIISGEDELEDVPNQFNRTAPIIIDDMRDDIQDVSTTPPMMTFKMVSKFVD